jgi:quinol monooxygenase YgiN
MQAACLFLAAMAVCAGVMAPVAHAQAPVAPPPPPDGPRYIVTYLEVMPTTRADGMTLVRQFRDATRKEAGNLRAEVLQRIGQLNQFVLLETWKDQAASETHAKAAATVQFRDKMPCRTRPLTSASILGFRSGRLRPRTVARRLRS